MYLQYPQYLTPSQPHHTPSPHHNTQIQPHLALTTHSTPPITTPPRPKLFTTTSTPPSPTPPLSRIITLPHPHSLHPPPLTTPLTPPPCPHPRPTAPSKPAISSPNYSAADPNSISCTPCRRCLKLFLESVKLVLDVVHKTCVYCT